jgi:hypothetical protein
MGILTLYGTKNNIKKFPCMHGNINFVWNKIKDKEKFPHVFHKQLYIHGIFPSIDRKNTGQQGNTEYNEHFSEGKENNRVGGSNPTCSTFYNHASRQY